MTADKPTESFASLFEAENQASPHKRPPAVALGDRCRAEVVQIGKDCVFAELVDAQGAGRRVQAYWSLDDLRGPDGALGVKLGDVVDAVVVELDAQGVRLGRSMGRPAGLSALSQAHAGRVAVEGKVLGTNKGGLEVEVGGVRGFCPISQADRGYLADPQELVGRTLSFLITELSDDGRRLVLSRRAVLEEEARIRADQTRAKLAVGAVLRGTVSAVREFGAFIDLGGIEGLVPKAELSYDRSASVEATLSAGDAVEVQVLDIKEGVDKRGRPATKISLSLKALASDPWEAIDAVAPTGKVIRGSVVRVAEFGAFVRLAPGVEGLLHVSELGGKVADASRVLKLGESLDVVVRNVDRAARKIALAPAPDGLGVGADVVGPNLVIGGLVKATVDRVEPYGVFVQLAGTRGRAGRGLIPNAELGTPRGSDTRKLFPLGREVTAKVLETGEGKLKLSIRAAREDEERAVFDGFREQAKAPEKLGTFADLLKNRK